jgi:thiol-disulfide isomerase/thioredoxin
LPAATPGTVVAVSDRPRRLPWTAVALSTVLALGAAVATYQLLTNDDAAEPPGDSLSLTPDDPVAPADASFTTFEGETVALPSIYGAPTVVNFFASTCVPCVTEMPAFEEVHQALGDDVAFLGLAVADRPEDALALVEDTGVTYPTAQDKDGSVIAALGGIVLPTTVLLRADGSIATTHTGELTADELTALIADELSIPG